MENVLLAARVFRGWFEFLPVLLEERRLFCREVCWVKLLSKAGGVGDVQLGGPGVAAAAGLRVRLSVVFPTVSVYYCLALGPEIFQMPLRMLNSVEIEKAGELLQLAQATNLRLGSLQDLFFSKSNFLCVLSVVGLLCPALRYTCSRQRYLMTFWFFFPQ